MQGGEELSDNHIETARMRWEILAEHVASEAEKLNELGLHKSVTNRLLEPFLYQTIIVSATEWENFFYLRDTDLAQPEIAVPAKMMRHALKDSEPEELDYGAWHTPLVNVDDEDRTMLLDYAQASDENLQPFYRDLLCKVSAARCARVSYLTHDGKRDVEADLALYNRLTKHGHWSPLEHVATPCPESGHKFNSHLGNFEGFDQLRHKVGG